MPHGHSIARQAGPARARSESALHILPADLDDARVIELLQLHASRARAETARGSAHALDLDGLRVPEIRCWTIWDGATLAGIGALKRLSGAHAEVKSMHVAEAMRGRGIGATLLRHLIAAAQAEGIARLSIETGARAYFRPAQALYRAHGFVECPPFADYRADPNSVFLSLRLRDD
jgi:putative acetyltransferase